MSSATTAAATTAPRPRDTEMQTGHVGLNVTDLARSTAFYQEVLGLSVVGGSQETERGYAFLADTKGRLVLTLWRQSTDTFDTTRPGLHHLSF